MRHLPLRTYQTLTRRCDRAGRLITPEERLEQEALRYPDAWFWEQRAQSEATTATRLIPGDLLNDAMALIEDVWFEAQTWLNIWRGWRRLLDAWRTNQQSDAMALAQAMTMAPA
jgi:hypothetical protein